MSKLPASEAGDEVLFCSPQRVYSVEEDIAPSCAPATLFACAPDRFFGKSGVADDAHSGLRRSYSVEEDTAPSCHSAIDSCVKSVGPIPHFNRKRFLS